MWIYAITLTQEEEGGQTNKLLTVESNITDAVQGIKIKSGKVEGGEAIEKQIQADIEKFAEELEKVLPGEKDKKTVVKKIVIKEKKEKKEFEKQEFEKQEKEEQEKKEK